MPLSAVIGPVSESVCLSFFVCGASVAVYTLIFRLKDGAGPGSAPVCVWLRASLYQCVCVSVCSSVRGGIYVCSD